MIFIFLGVRVLIENSLWHLKALEQACCLVVYDHALGALSAMWGNEIQESMEKAASLEGAIWLWINLMQLLQSNVNNSKLFGCSTQDM